MGMGIKVADKQVSHGTRVGYVDPNPDTWIRAAWGQDDALLSSEPPLGINTTEWFIIRAHVFEGKGFATITQSIAEPPARLQMFAEEATRRVLPERSISAQVSQMGTSGGADELTRQAVFLSNVRELYAACGSPLGDTPEAPYQFIAALADNAAAIQVLRDVVTANTFVIDSGAPVLGTIPAHETTIPTTT